ncbi:MAG: hypothetical protein EBU36_07015, partial [Verrucomicrobia bacterium]|nr:hypothetical protein [Verrucomicrobiota bacterium]
MLKSVQRRELKDLLGTLGASQLVAGWDTEEVCPGVGLSPSATAFLAVNLVAESKKEGCLVVAQGPKEQEELAAEIEAWGGEPLVIPEAYRGEEKVRPDPDLQAEWIGALGRCLEKPHPRLILATEQVLREKHPLPELVKKGLKRVQRGDLLDPLELTEECIRAGYQKVHTVAERGEVARRGGIVDIYSMHADLPVRMEWGGDRIESIRNFDLHEQIGIGEVPSTTIFLGRPGDMTREGSLMNYLQGKWGKLVCSAEAEGEPRPGFAVSHGFSGEPIRESGLAEARRRRVGSEVRAWLARGWRVVMTGVNEGEAARLEEWLAECDVSPEEIKRIEFVLSGLSRGFACPEREWVIVTGAELLGRTESYRGHRRTMGRSGDRWKRPVFDPGELKLGDYAVHLQHGVAIYEGLGDKPGGKGQCLLLKYADGARLYVPVEESYLVSRYVGVGRKRPMLDTLGGGRWERAKAKAEKAVEDFAATLLRTAAEREAMPGNAFPPDHEWQAKFE